jgi:hypothetical protein
MFLRAFLVVLSLGVAALFALQSTPDIRPFNGDRISIDLDVLPREDVAALKIAHALETETYDVGVFGNSRAIGLRSEYLKLDGQTFFNFAVPGTSFRQSVEMVEKLARAGRMPKFAIIVVDNMSLQYFANPIYPGPPTRWYSAIDDLSFGWRSESVGQAEYIRMIKRHILLEWQAFSDLFNVRILKARRGFGVNIDSDRAPYAADGSRFQSVGVEARGPEKINTAPTNIIPAYLVRDLGRLAQTTRAEGSLVVETPLEPSSVDISPQVATKLRSHMRTTCKSLKIECIGPPGSEAGTVKWPDSSHPPVEWFGDWIGQHLGSQHGGA